MNTFLAIGGCHLDRIGKAHATFISGASNPGAVTEWVGGCTANAVSLIAQCGVADITFISARGGDAAGNQVEAFFAAHAIADKSAIFLDRATPTYTAIVDTSGDLIGALADMEIYETGLPRHIRRRDIKNTIAKSATLLVDANLPADAISDCLEAAAGTKIALAISVAKAPRLIPSAPSLDLVFMNNAELQAITGLSQAEGAIGQLRSLGFRTVVITNGSAPIQVVTAEAVHRLPIPSVGEIMDVVGAGDALAGATIAAMLSNEIGDVTQCVKIGIAAAQIAVQTRGPRFVVDWTALKKRAEDMKVERI